MNELKVDDGTFMVFTHTDTGLYDILLSGEDGARINNITEDQLKQLTTSLVGLLLKDW